MYSPVIFSLFFIYFFVTVTVSFQDRAQNKRSSTKITSLSSLEELKKIIKTSSGIIVVSYTAEWCQICQSTKYMYVQLAEEYGDRINFFSTSDDDISSAYNVIQLPTYRIYRNGREQYTASGKLAVEIIADQLAKLVKKRE